MFTFSSLACLWRKSKDDEFFSNRVHIVSEVQFSMCDVYVCSQQKMAVLTEKPLIIAYNWYFWLNLWSGKLTWLLKWQLVAASLFFMSRFACSLNFGERTTDERSNENIEWATLSVIISFQSVYILWSLQWYEGWGITYKLLPTVMIPVLYITFRILFFWLLGVLLANERGYEWFDEVVEVFSLRSAISSEAVISCMTYLPWIVHTLNLVVVISLLSIIDFVYN